MQNNNPEAAIMFGQAALRTATNNKESAQGYYILSGLRVFSIEQRDLKKAQGYCLEAFKLDPDFKETNPESPLVLLCEKVIADESIE